MKKKDVEEFIIATDFPNTGLLADHIGDEVNEMMRRLESLRGIAVGTVVITSKEVEDPEGVKHHEFIYSDHQAKLLKGAKWPKELPKDLTPQTKYIGRVLQNWEGKVTGRLYVDISPEGTLTPQKFLRFKLPVEEGTL